MVRLKATNAGFQIAGVSMFQFQNGAIKSTYNLTMNYGLAVFQFQNGAIKRIKPSLSIIDFACFNSKMVRLKAVSVHLPTH